MAVKKIKVYHVITRMIIGGAQENTLYTVEGLHDDPRFDVKLITGPAVGREGELLSRARRKGIAIEEIPLLRRAINPLKDTSTLFRLYRIFKKERPHIVHTHSSKAGILGRLAARMAQVPVIIHTIHGLPFHPYQNSFQNSMYVFLEKLCTRFSDKIIVVANAMRDSCLRNGISTRDRYIRIFSGMETETFTGAKHLRNEIRGKYGINKNDFVILKIARLFPLKGHSDVVAAAPELCRKYPDLKFMFVGDGVLQEKIETKIRKNGLEKRFVFTGLVPPEEIPGCLAAADAVVHTSYREGLARVLPQGLLSGKPVISYDIDGAPEVIENGINGKLVPPGSIRDLVRAVSRVHDDYGLYENNVEMAVSALSERFSVENMVKDIINCYLTFSKKLIK